MLLNASKILATADGTRPFLDMVRILANSQEINANRY